MVLERIKDRFNCGYIKSNSLTDKTDRSLAYVVRDLPSIRDIVIPFFEGKLVIKKDAFEKFKQVIKFVDQKRHLTSEGIIKILDLAYSMNTQKRRVEKELILKSYQK